MFQTTALTILLAASAAQTPPSEAAYLPRVAVEDGQFHIPATGERFHPRGFQYIRLTTEQGIYAFGPGRYDAAAVEAMFSDLEEHGFNVVRVFLDEPGVTNDAGLNPDLMANFVDFLRRATRRRIYVIPVPHHVPNTGPYAPYHERARAEFPDLPGLSYPNMRYLTESLVAGKCKYLQDLLAAIKEADPGLLSTLLAIELENESCFHLDTPPFSGAPSTLRVPATGKTYATGDEQGVQRLMDDAIKVWANACVQAVHEVDPDALVSTSVFTFRAVGRSGPARTHQDETSDSRVPARPLALAATDLSYIDIHIYVPSVAELSPQLASVEMEPLREACARARKPLFVGEIGALMGHYATPGAAAKTMPGIFAALRSEGFAGYSYWTYDCHEQPEVWNAKSDGGVIFDTIAALRNSLGQP